MWKLKAKLPSASAYHPWVYKWVCDGCGMVKSTYKSTGPTQHVCAGVSTYTYNYAPPIMSVNGAGLPLVSESPSAPEPKCKCNACGKGY